MDQLTKISTLGILAATALACSGADGSSSYDMASPSEATAASQAGAESESTSSSSQALVTIAGDACVVLYAGQTINAGSVCASIEGENVKVTYTTTNGWELTEAHLWAGATIATIPSTPSGNPKVGHFPYTSGALTPTTTYSFAVPLSTFGLSSAMTACGAGQGVNAFFVAHGVVRKRATDGSYQTETSYGAGTRMVARGNWATYYSINLSCSGATNDRTCETAFARDNAASTCFIGKDFEGDIAVNQFQRWGWSNGPLAAGSYQMPIYAAAGQCDLSKGANVGTLGVEYNGSSATVTYSMKSGFTMDETHLYVGSAPLATKNGEYTVAPGQFPNTRNLTKASTDSFTVNGLSGNIYVVAHAVACSTQWPW